jgi:hypothetical protein
MPKLEFSSFEPYVGKQLEIVDPATGDVQLTMNLTKARQLPALTEEQPTAFTLFMDGPSSTPLDQGTFMFRIGGFGDVPIFIVPVGQSGDIRTYQAIFN